MGLFGNLDRIRADFDILIPALQANTAAIEANTLIQQKLLEVLLGKNIIGVNVVNDIPKKV